MRVSAKEKNWIISEEMSDNTSDQIKQFKDFILNYNKLSEICFMDCVHDFTQRNVSSKEETCANNCFDKFLKMNQRISQRFQELQLILNDKQSDLRHFKTFIINSIIVSLL